MWRGKDSVKRQLITRRTSWKISFDDEHADGHRRMWERKKGREQDMRTTSEWKQGKRQEITVFYTMEKVEKFRNAVHRTPDYHARWRDWRSPGAERGKIWSKERMECAVKVERAPRMREKVSRDLVSNLQRTPLADVHGSLSEDLPEA